MPGRALRREAKSARLALLLLAGVACERGGPDAAAGEAAAGEPRALPTATAFDLAPAPDGAVLAWATPDDGGVVLLRLDADGVPASGGAPTRVTVAGAAVGDLTLAATAAGVAVAWSEVDASADHAGALRAAWVHPDGSARRFDVGRVFRSADARRGALSLAPRERGALLLARGLAAGCADVRERDCSAFQFYDVGPEAARPTGLALTVPSPCAAHSAQLVAAQRTGAGGPFEYAICAGPAGATALTVFSIQPSPAYATAEEALAGCEPLGAGRFGGEATFVGACAGQRRGVSVPAAGGALVVRDLDQRGLVCTAGGPVLRFGEGWLRPSEPLGHLELLLNDDLAPPGARAVWTGNALVVAQMRDGRLVTARHGCRGTRWLELEGSRSTSDSQ